MNREVKLKTIETDIKKLGEVLKEAAQTITEQGISNYPIFIAHQYSLNMGISLIDKDTMGTNWSLNASTLEELATKNIIIGEKLENFRQIYKSPQDFVCIFIVDATTTEFLFYPYEEEVAGDAVSD